MVRKQRCIADCDSLFNQIREARQAASGKQLADPQKLAAAVLTRQIPPAHWTMEFDGAQDRRNDVDLKCSRNKSLKSPKFSNPAILAALETVVEPTQHSAAID